MIRAVLPSDTAVLVALGEATGIFGPGESDALLRDTLDALHAGQLGADHDVRMWIDPSDERPGGWVYFGPRAGAEVAWELYWIGVHPTRHGQGIGDALLRFVERHVRNAGGGVLFIETSSLPPLERARRFYVDRGYTISSVTRNHYGDGRTRSRSRSGSTAESQSRESTPSGAQRMDAGRWSTVRAAAGFCSRQIAQTMVVSAAAAGDKGFVGESLRPSATLIFCVTGGIRDRN